MKTSIKVALISLSLVCGAFVAAQPVMADDVSVAVGPGGGIAFGYNDGYWDRTHNWHAWRNAQEAAAWRREHTEHYYDWRHDRDRDMGWREERWWETH